MGRREREKVVAVLFVLLTLGVITVGVLGRFDGGFGDDFEIVFMPFDWKSEN